MPTTSLIRITERQAALIYALELHGAQPIRKLARSLKLREATVHAEIQRLKEINVLQGIIPLLHMGLLGYEEWCCFLTLRCAHDRERRAAELFITQHPLVTWFAQAGGSYQYFLSFCVRDSAALASFFGALSNRFGAIIQDKHLATIIMFATFGRKYLASSPPRSAASLSYRTTRESAPYVIDETDRTILDAISPPQFYSDRELARACKLPTSTFDRRITQLVRRNIVVGYVHTVNTRAIGIQSYKVLIFSRGMLQSTQKRLFTWAQSHPNVVTYIECIGPWDIELRIEVWAAENATDVTRALLDEFGEVIASIELVPLFGFTKSKNFPTISKSLREEHPR